MTVTRRSVEKRKIKFSKRTVTKIWSETASELNPYIAADHHCHGYSLFELMAKRSFVDVLFLMFQGELPSQSKGLILEQLMIAQISPGPRHPATRAAMTAGVGKTDVVHILPIGLSILGGSIRGAAEVKESMDFINSSLGSAPEIVARGLLKDDRRPDEGDWQVAPGFGSYYGDIDPFQRKIAAHLAALPGSGDALQWSTAFANEISVDNLGWLPTGVAAAVLLDLGFNSCAGAGIFQLISAPGLLAHGLELIDKPLTAMPFPDDENYIIEE